MSAAESAHLPIDPLAALADPEAPLATVLRAVREAEAQHADLPVVRFGLSASVVTDLLATMLQRRSLLAATRADVTQGALGAHLENLDAFAAAGVRHACVVLSLDAVMPAFEERAATAGEPLMAAVEQRVRQELALIAERAPAFATLHLGLFHRLTPQVCTATSEAADRAVARLNAVVVEAASAPGVQTLDVAAALAAVGIDRAVDNRFRFRFGAPYSARACDEIARRVVGATRAGGTYLRKALVLDCDGTLWGGIVGEDGPEGIRLDPNQYPGSTFWSVQHQLVALQQQGVLLCLASKNNPEDVAEVFANHPAMVLRPEHLILSEVGWHEKGESIERIAATLGIGLDSVVFVDDSPYELEAVRARLPDVTLVRVPAEAWAWPSAFGAVAELFTTGRSQDADADKTSQYRALAAAKSAEAGAGDRATFLATLELRVRLGVDVAEQVERISELTQKSNQFNLTTRRYGVGEIAHAMADPNRRVVSLSVSDRFADHGLTGVIVLRLDAPVCTVEAFLLSCRVLGRDVEMAPWQVVCALARDAGCSTIRATFRPTRKNAQVAPFWPAVGLVPIGDEADGTTFEADLSTTALCPPPHHLEALCDH